MTETPKKIEWSVRPITRYQVIRYVETDSSAGTSQHGTFDNAEVAYEVGYALAESDRVRFDIPLGDDRVQYPKGVPSSVWTSFMSA